MRSWQKFFRIAWCFLAAAVLLNTYCEAIVCATLFVLVWLVLLVVALVMRIKDTEASAAAKEHRRIVQEKKAEHRHRSMLDTTPVSATALSSCGNTKTKSGLGAAFVGGLLFGLPGVVGGAALVRGRTTGAGEWVKFSVKYKSGRVGTETVRAYSTRFNELMAVTSESESAIDY